MLYEVITAAICNYYKQQYHVLVEPEQVLVTSGSSPAILLVLMVLLNAGDEILVITSYSIHYTKLYDAYVLNKEDLGVALKVLQEGLKAYPGRVLE